MPSLTVLNCPACNSPISPGTKFCASCGPQLAQQGGGRDPLIGQFVGGRFLVQAKLGEGGRGAVYQAEQVAMKRPVALKVLHPHLCQDQSLIERFHREAAASSRLNHPNTITVHDFGQTDEGTLYIAMEFVDGRSLADEIGTIASLPWSRAVHVALQIAESLADAHAAGVVHRDLKPDNIMLLQRAGSTDFVKLLDFGIAKIADAAEGGDKRKALTKTGMIFGTPQYMSPEQIRGSGVDHRTDIYSLGVILYHLLTGELPFAAENPMGMLTKHLMEPPRPMRSVRPGLDCPPQLESLVLRCLEKEPERRPRSMAEIVPELAALAGDTRPGFAVQTPAPVVQQSGALGPLRTSSGVDNTPPPTAVLQATPLPFAGAPGSFGGQATPGVGPLVGGPGTGYGYTPTPMPGARASRGGGGKVALLVVLVVLLLGGAGAGAVFAWRLMGERTEPRDGTTGEDGTATTAQTMPTVPTYPTYPTGPTTPTTPTTPTDPTTPTAPTPADAGTATGDAGSADVRADGGPGRALAACEVVAGEGSRSEALAKALAEREGQVRLCLNPLTSKTFDGRLELSYDWSTGKAPGRFKAAKNTLGDRSLAVCMETVVAMVQHPESKRTTKAYLHVDASGGGGALKACKVTTGVVVPRTRSKTDPKPDLWPGYPGYGGF